MAFFPLTAVCMSVKSIMAIRTIGFQCPVLCLGTNTSPTNTALPAVQILAHIKSHNFSAML